MDDKRKRDLEDEMSRFESEISGNLPPPPKIPMVSRPPPGGGGGGRPPPRHIPSFPIPPPPPHMFPPRPPTLPPGMLPPPPGMIPPPMIPPMMLPPPIGAPVIPLAVDPSSATTAGGSGKKKEKKKTVVRVAGGEVWEDPTLLEWDPNDFRIFVGDLGNEVSDDALLRAFSKYPSLLKAKIVRDRKTKKSKGYGFVSFKDPQDYLKAMREMNGRYVGNRPIKLRKSSWKERNIGIAKKKDKEKKKLGIK